MTLQTIICLLIFAVVIMAFATNALPMALTAMIGMTLMIVTGCLDGTSAISYFSSTTVILLGSIFIVASAFGKTQVVDKISRLVINLSKGSFMKVVAGYVILVLVVGQLINSSSALFCMAYPVALACCKELQASPSKIMYPIGITCMATSGIIPSTAAISMCEVWRPYFDAYEITDFTYSVLDYCIARIPLALVVVLFAIFYAPKHLPDTIAVTEGGTQSTSSSAANSKQYTPMQEKIVVATFIAVIIGVAIGGNFGIPSWEVSMIGALIVITCGALRGGEIYTSMGLTVIFLCVGGTGMATALQQTGAADLIGNAMVNLFGSHPNGYVVGLVFFLVPCIVAQFITNSPANYIFVPICLMTCKAFGGNPVGPMFLVISGALCGFLTPMANPTASIMYGVGGYKIKDIAKIAPLLICAVGIVSVAWVMTIYPLY